MTRPVVAVSTKAYLGFGETQDWVRAVGRCADEVAALGVEVVVLPTFPALESTADILAGTGIAWGAQDVAPSADGAQTGEVTAAVLAELGCRYVEVGHAERRRFFGESPETVRAKTTEVVTAGMIPLLCVGEADRTDPGTAAALCADQARDALAGLPEADVLLGYEPQWAIGAPAPAPPAYVLTVLAGLRAALASHSGRLRIVYGGAAGPGLATDLGPGVDGLFLGRFAHDPRHLHSVIREIAAVHSSPPVPHA